jgi:hypothetical protein
VGLRRGSEATDILGVAGLNPASSTDVCIFMIVVCCQVEASVSGLSLVQRSPTHCGVSECDREASIKRRSWPTGGC